MSLPNHFATHSAAMPRADQSPNRFARSVWSRGIAALALALTASLLTPRGASAQIQPIGNPPGKAQPSEKQSPLMLYSDAMGDEQNRGRGAGDDYWGVLDGNEAWYRAVLGRVPNINSYPYMQMDGWTFPRLSSKDGVFFPQFPTTDPNYSTTLTASQLVASADVDGEPPTVNAPAPVNGIAWSQVTGPSTDVQSSTTASPTVTPAYYRAVAYPRPAAPAQTLNAYNKFVWRFDNSTGTIISGQPTVNIPGIAGQQVRYRVFVHVPSPAGGENRIDDARYVVYYYVKAGGAYYPKQQVCIGVSQTDDGNVELMNPDHSVAFFPFFSTATFASKGVAAAGVTLPAQPTGSPTAPVTPGNPAILQGVAVDNTTEDGGDSLYVLADTLQLNPSFNTVSATPTVTPPHGGRKVATDAGNGTASVLIQPKPYLPDYNAAPTVDPAYSAVTVAPHRYDSINNFYGDTAGNNDFINDINDVAYGGAGYAAYQPWNVSTTFQGPKSLIDPRFSGTDFAGGGAGVAVTNRQIGLIDPLLSDRPVILAPANPANPVAGQTINNPARAVDATNNALYPAPYFSHLQVLIARTEYVQDPETGLNGANKSGTKTIQVGAVYALDWLTGAPVWRFPDRTYLPGTATLNNVAIPGAGMRNPQVGIDSITAKEVDLVPGIVAYDVNGDGVISDDEVYIGAQGANVNGGVFASVTLAPKVQVQGAVQIPVHDLTTTTADQPDISGVAAAQPGRYYDQTAGSFSPVTVGMAYIAAANGVIYGVDAYGNNDTRYFPGAAIPTGGAYTGTYVGRYKPGTTNVLWSFSAINHGQLPASGTIAAETAQDYYTRLKGEIPATGSFGGSSPVLAWNLTDGELAAYAANPAGGLPTPELRLFAGNQNGLLYALDPTAIAGQTFDTSMPPVPNGVQSLPIIKGAQANDSLNPAVTNSYYGIASSGAGADPYGVLAHQGDLRWWFQTQGGINAPPAVSLVRHDMTTGFDGSAPVGAAHQPIQKGVYVTTAEGRVYCVDWDGPVDLQIPHTAYLSTATAPNLSGSGPVGLTTAYDGSTSRATLLNDNYYFHNTIPATGGIADTTQGRVRPRWVYPNLYRSNTGAGSKKATDAADPAVNAGPNGAEISGLTLAEPSALGHIQSAPVLLDFWWRDPDNAASVPALLDYVAFVANDPTSVGTPATQSRVYLLDQIGDRDNFLTNPRASSVDAAGAPTANARVISQPKDRYSPNTLLASANDPTTLSGLTWTYRYQYDYYPAAGAAPGKQTATEVQLRNGPLYNTAANPALHDAVDAPPYLLPNSHNIPLHPNTNDIDPSVAQAITMTSPFAAVLSDYVVQPGRRMLPTLYTGGMGELYALDIDPETGLFMRWRPTSGDAAHPASFMELFTPLSNRIDIGPSDPTKGDKYPGDSTPGTGTGIESTANLLSPLDHIFDDTAVTPSPTTFGYKRSALGTQQILARVVPLLGDRSLVTSLSVSGGPVQARNSVVGENGSAPPVAPSVPGRPTNDIPNLQVALMATVAPPGTATGTSTVTDPTGATIGQTAATSTTLFDFDGLASDYSSVSVLTLGGHVTGKVNQDINDPLTTTRGRLSSYPDPALASGAFVDNPAHPAIHNTSFQYPLLFVSTVGSYLHGISSNIEGEDRMAPAPSVTDAAQNISAAGDSHPVGWGFAPPGNPKRLNDAGHVHLFVRKGPGGQAGVAVITNAYYPAIDPFATQYRNGAAVTLNAAPNNVADEPGSVTSADDPASPRPDFKPRPLVNAQAAVAGTNAATVADTDSGQSGFPLDLSGLFFDRQFAGAAGTQFIPNVAGQYSLGDYHNWLRLPGYSSIGARLGANGLPPFTDIANNQHPDGIRTIDPFAGAANAGDQISDDINPSGQDAAWIYTGGDDGVVYAYTPAILGHDTGLEGGEEIRSQVGALDRGGLANSATSLYDTIATGNRPQIDIFTQAQLTALLAALKNPLITPSPDTWGGLSIAGQGGKNYYEWGETVYILVYDLLARPYSPGARRYQSYVPSLPYPGPLGIPQGGLDRSIAIDITSSTGGEQAHQVVSLQGANADGTGALLQYYLDTTGAVPTYRQYNPAAPPAGATPLGVAVYEYHLGNNPTAGHSQTPGDYVEIHVTPTVSTLGVAQGQGALPAGVGAEPGLAAASSPAAFFAIANPLAIQGFLQATQPDNAGNLQAVTVPTPANGYDVNGIGPFQTDSEQIAAGSPKQQVDTTKDPNLNGSQYWQALTNGNFLQRMDDNPYLAPIADRIVNPNAGHPLTIAGGGAEPQFYFPVATSAGYINHGATGSTGVGKQRQYLRLMNRSLLGRLAKVRVLPDDQPGDLLFRAWPGTVMNADADPTLNKRLTPAGMDPLGRITPLPWESVPAEAKPWNAGSLVNNSPDYPDVQARKNRAVQVTTPVGDLTTTPGTLEANINDNAGDRTNGSIGTANSGPGNGIPNQFATSVNITMPAYQPANLVAAHELTSTYIPANPTDFPAGVAPIAVGPQGPIQLPRGSANRTLVPVGGNNQVLTPFGYTSRMVAFIDNDGSNRLTPTGAANRVTGTDPNHPEASTTIQAQKAYREFEVWAGVPVDQSMKVVESVIDLGAHPHGFGIQNSILGYNPVGGPNQSIGLTPIPSIVDPNKPYYQNYFKSFTIQNTGNVNLYNLRASQRVENPLAPGAVPGSGSPFSYFLLRSGTVDPLNGILAVGADPKLAGNAYLNPGVMPQIVTSLDPLFDAAWDAYTQAEDNTDYTLYYQQFHGRHTLHKTKVAAATPSVLAIPDVPTNQSLPGSPKPVSPTVAVGIPIGTPVGVYSSANASSPFTVFEDHDTNGNGYVPTPAVPAGSATTFAPIILPAGPLYHGRSDVAPGANPILTAGAGNGEGVWRAQSFNAATKQYVPLPFTYPYLTVKVEVEENALTGEFPDLPGILNGINTGVLPSVDKYPAVTGDTVNGSTVYRPSSALTPAAWRDSSGNLHVYYARNDSASAGGTPYGAQPGAPYKLYHSKLTWDGPTGSWNAQTSAPPASPLASPTANTDRWFTSPIVLPTSGDVNAAPIGPYESNTSPYVLTHITGANVVDGATLFFLDSVPTQGGAPRNRILYMDVTADGSGGAPVEYFANADPSFARYAPRVTYDAVNSRDYLMYYGGTPGKWSLYYVSRGADAKGLPNDPQPDASQTRGIEVPLTLPSAIVSASEPAPVFRQIVTTAGVTQNVVDVYYTGISRATQTPDIYMNRYATDPAGKLTLTPLSAVANDRLASVGRDNLWQSHNIAWISALNAATLPTVTWGPNGVGPATVVGNWKYDNASGLLYQVVGGTPATLTYVYVDASAGTVRFHGPAAPTSKDTVTATYTPQTYRLTGDGAANYGGYTFLDNQILPATTGTNTVIRRQQPMISGRNYLYWQKGAISGKAPTLYNAIRRVGINLKDPANMGAMDPSLSILLGQPAPPPDPNRNQTPDVTSVTVNGAAIKYDVDYNSGRIFVEPQYEGLQIVVTYNAVLKGSQGTAGAAPIPESTTGVLAYLDDVGVASTGNIGAALPVKAAINEGQASAFLDLFNPLAVGGFARTTATSDPPFAIDPTLVPGKTWVFWTSPRGRLGQPAAGTADPFPGGYNVYWETIAPIFEPNSVYTSP